MSRTDRQQRVVALGALSAIGEATLRLYAEEGARLLLALESNRSGSRRARRR